ncbi:hypothetical protein IQ235_00905 [Oscillatoriales cyanobacterium LEGE 11467]|uniref:Uncharacterized protein n=1 Tax=Zarconia navalis LEGE 11467 TaxID=1828826 RepID=A0A928Z7F6_9CYAN|nr:hypothetical protein [Zarconia navalis]MBE9039354.1 hypothetical protein [Zarconia navalis LEGE 11467]
MAFLNWWKTQPESEDYSLEVKGKLFPTATSSQPLAGADTARKDLGRAMHDKGADMRGAMDANHALETEILGNSAYELARELNSDVTERGAAMSHRALPKPAQEGLLAGRIRAKYDLQGTEIAQDDQTETNQQIEASMRQSGRETRKWLPW